MNLGELGRSLKRSWWVVVVGVVAGGAAAAAYLLVQTPLYSSSTQLFVSTTTSGTITDAVQGSQLSQQRVASYARLVAGEELASRVVDDLGSTESPASLAGSVSATVLSDTVIIEVTVSDPSPVEAQRIAESIGEQFPLLVDQIEPSADSGMSTVRVTVVEQPDLPTAPSSPLYPSVMAIGLFLGAVFGAGASILRVQLDRTVHDAETATELSGAPVIGVILRDEALAREHVVDRHSLSRTAEGYRQLRTNLQFLHVDEPPKVIMVSSAVPSEGKTTLAINLALGLAQVGRTVTVVEADLRRPRVTRYLGMVGGVGLTNILTGSAAVEDVQQPYGDGNLSVIAAGPTPPNPSELLASTHMFSLLEELRQKNDFVLLDAPPLLPVADSSALAVLVDGVVLSVHYGKTRKDQLAQTRATLDGVGGRTLGVVLNIVPPKAEVTSAYGYGYDYGYDPDPKPQRTS